SVASDFVAGAPHRAAPAALATPPRPEDAFRSRFKAARSREAGLAGMVARWRARLAPSGRSEELALLRSILDAGLLETLRGGAKRDDRFLAGEQLVDGED